MKFLITGIILGILLVGADWAMAADFSPGRDPELAQHDAGATVAECHIFTDEHPEGIWCCDCATKKLNPETLREGHWAAGGIAPKAQDGKQ